MNHIHYIPSRGLEQAEEAPVRTFVLFSLFLNFYVIVKGKDIDISENMLFSLS